ncbi:hypothetical protein CLCR_04468 [Cladophialophora carrionii]|uniref:Uncharacterized protein n=1 Tax=Cladophialophora carrionii TaxID=86049 RepID=A0A1C1CHS6_9EURO|nr:hypothetical protein CLCR_04468 [Cladophialophora carrionii]
MPDNSNDGPSRGQHQPLKSETIFARHFVRLSTPTHDAEGRTHSWYTLHPTPRRGGDSGSWRTTGVTGELPIAKLKRERKGENSRS